METAQKLFELMGGDSGKLDGPPPSWDKQPEHLKDVFREKCKPGSRFYHYGLNTVFAFRGDGSLYMFQPMTDWEARQHPSSHRAPRTPSKGHLDLQAILVLENEMSTISVRISDKEERRNERARIQKEIYELWRGISPEQVSKAVLMELYEAHVHKGADVRLPAWMQAIADQKRESAEREAANKAWLEGMTEEDRKEYFDSRDVKDFESQCRREAVDLKFKVRYPRPTDGPILRHRVSVPDLSRDALNWLIEHHGWQGSGWIRTGHDEISFDLKSHADRFKSTFG